MTEEIKIYDMELSECDNKPTIPKLWNVVVAWCTLHRFFFMIILRVWEEDLTMLIKLEINKTKQKEDFFDRHF